MSDKGNLSTSSEFKVKGILTEKGIKISDKSNIDALSQRGYGTKENEEFTLTFYEALYLLDKLMLEVQNDKKQDITFQDILSVYETKDENAWAHYLVYRDLRSRGYVAREGFGKTIDFRIYERGAYGKDSAQYLVVSTQEGKPQPMKDLAEALIQSQSLKKELIVAVMNRRGEIVYYSVAPLTFK